MQKIPFSVGKASDVGVMPINADATNGGVSGGLSVFAGLVLSKTGKPNTVLSVTPSNFKSVLGEPFRAVEGTHFESLRHVAMALNGGNGYVVRVPFPGMKVPTISLLASTTGAANKAADKQAEKGVTTIEVVTGAVPFGSEIALPDKAIITFYVDDGDKSTDRTLSFIPVAAKAGFYTLALKKTDSMGAVTTLESYEVSFDHSALDDMSKSAYVADVLESGESRIRCVMTADAALPDNYAGFQSTAFVGGSDGDVSKLTAESYDAAIAALSNSLVDFTAILTLGIYDPVVIGKLATLAKSLRVDAFGDINPRLSASDALAQMSQLGLGGNENIALYYFPYSCRDPVGQTNVIFGLSGDVFVAKSKGVALTPDVGGWHYSPAGVDRGTLSRINVKPLAAAGMIDREAFAKAHINVVASTSGNIVIDDALTASSASNHKQYQHVVSVLNSIARNFYALGQALKHQPDGITREGWERGLPKLLDRYVAAGALVKPTDVSQGDAPYIVSVEKLDFDFWKVTYSVCVTGVGRRFIGEPVLFG